MHKFLSNNRDELIARCKLKVAQRPHRAATQVQLANGVPMFLDQLTRTLRAEEADEGAESMRISGPAGGDALALSEIGITATAHGKELLQLGYTVDQVVHDYGDLCQSITDLAYERDAPFAIDEFRTLNRCLDNAIADAVTAFSAQRDSTIAQAQKTDAAQRVGFLVHELRNGLATAMLAVSALELGKMSVSGATGAVLKRSLSALEGLINRSLIDVRSSTPEERSIFAVQAFIAEAHHAAQLAADAAGSKIVVSPVDMALGIEGNRDLLLAAVANLLQNAFKFTHAHTAVSLDATDNGDHVLIKVSDHCGGLPEGSAERIFLPFVQTGEDRSGLGLGLSIARQNVEADGGTLTVEDIPGTGCVFTIRMPAKFLP